MEFEPNPVYKVGQRNYECPNYERCVDHALKSQWQFWACSHCPNQLQGTAVSLVRRAQQGGTHSVEHHPN